MRNPCGDGIVMYLDYINVDGIYLYMKTSYNDTVQ